jgi:hypothetical protein
MFLLWGLFLYDDCARARMFQFDQPMQILKTRISFPFANDIVCLNVSIPDVAISFLDVANASVEVYRSAQFGPSLQHNSTLTRSRLGVVDFGNDTGTILIRSLSPTGLSYSVVAYPPACRTRITSIMASDSLEIKADGGRDGSVGPLSTICYFSSLHGDVRYSLDLDLQPDLAKCEIHSFEGLQQTFTGKTSITFYVRASDDPVLFVIVNMDKIDRLRNSVALAVAGADPSASVRARWESGGIALFFGERPALEATPGTGAFFTMSALLFLCLVIAGAAYLVLKAFQKNQKPHPPAVPAQAEQVPVTELLPRVKDREPDDGNPDFPPD